MVNVNAAHLIVNVNIVNVVVLSLCALAVIGSTPIKSVEEHRTGSAQADQYHRCGLIVMIGRAIASMWPYYYDRTGNNVDVA